MYFILLLYQLLLIYMGGIETKEVKHLMLCLVLLPNI